MKSEAYIKGYRAWEKGMNLSDNPYDQDKNQEELDCYLAWKQGYEDSIQQEEADETS